MSMSKMKTYDVLIDIGSKTGALGWFALELGLAKSVDIIEPVDDNIEVINKVLAIEILSDRVVHHRVTDQYIKNYSGKHIAVHIDESRFDSFIIELQGMKYDSIIACSSMDCSGKCIYKHGVKIPYSINHEFWSTLDADEIFKVIRVLGKRSKIFIDFGSKNLCFSIFAKGFYRRVISTMCMDVIDQCNIHGIEISDDITINKMLRSSSIDSTMVELIYFGDDLKFNIEPQLPRLKLMQNTKVLIDIDTNSIDEAEHIFVLLYCQYGFAYAMNGVRISVDEAIQNKYGQILFSNSDVYFM